MVEEGSGIFGLKSSEEESDLWLIPVPWDATTSYRQGTSMGPEAILAASPQIDHQDPSIANAFEPGIHMLQIPKQVQEWNKEAKSDPEKTNALSKQVESYVYETTKKAIDSNKFVGVVGGEHSVPLGALKAMAEKHDLGFGVLQIDAHFDLRDSYQGFTQSHASIMRNALEQIPQIEKLVSVGIRDYCKEEEDYLNSQGGRALTFYDWDLKRRQFSGKSWREETDEIISTLPGEIWVSFDIDGLNPTYCPDTGTPVPGGLEWSEAIFLIGEYVRNGGIIIGFDLCEVTPSLKTILEDDWNANVGMRTVAALANRLFASQGKARFKDAD